MSCLIDDLLKLGKVNRQQLSLCDVGLRRLVEEVVHELEAETANRKIEWRIEALPVIQCDRGLMKQVLTNLISNAIKYSRTRDPAIIEVRGVLSRASRHSRAGQRRRFDLTSAEKLFSPFQRFHRAKSFEDGIGLAVEALEWAEELFGTRQIETDALSRTRMVDSPSIKTPRTSIIAGSRVREYLIALEIRLVNTCFISPRSHWMTGNASIRPLDFLFAVSASSS